MRELQIPSGFRFDYTNALNEWAVTEADIEAIRPRIEAALVAADEMRRTGVVAGHMSKDGEPEKVLFPQLPYVKDSYINTPDVMAQLEALTAHVKDNVDVVISFGIGGSFLGGKVIFDVHGGEFWNQQTKEERNGFPKLYFSGNNVDPFRTNQLIAQVKAEAKRVGASYKAMLILISKSGSTIEPMSNFMIVQQALEDAGIAYEVVAVTDPATGPKETLLHKLACQQGWQLFSVPDGVGGRFSVFTEVGLVIGAVIGFDCQAFLDGARAMDTQCTEADLFANPALLSATLKYLSATKYGRNIEVMMPYGDCLKSFSEWYVQLLAESLGKVKDPATNERYGRSPIVAVGTTDMHAQTQEHQEGPYNKWIQFVRVQDWGTKAVVPHTYDSYDKLAAFSGLELGDILKAALQANADALAGDHRFSAVYEIPEVSAFHLGSLMFMCCWAIFYEGQLAGVDAFNQPGVEVYKKLLGPKLRALKEETGK